MKELMIALIAVAVVAVVILVKYLVWSLAHPSAPVWTFFFTGK